MKTTGRGLLIGVALIATSFDVLTIPVLASEFANVTLVAPLDSISSVTADIVAFSG